MSTVHAARSARIVILGGHGKVALLAAPKLSAVGYEVDSVIRNPEQRAAVEEAEATPVVLDIESASVEDLARLFAGATAVVFSAGAGGGNAERTHAVDYEAATRAIDAARQARVRRFVMVSYAGAGTDLDRLTPDDPFYPYAKAKSEADAYLRATDLDFTILGPGRLTLEPATDRIRLGGTPAQKGDGDFTSRDNVASVIAHVISANVALGEKVDFFDGPTPIAEAIR